MNFHGLAGAKRHPMFAASNKELHRSTKKISFAREMNNKL